MIITPTLPLTTSTKKTYSNLSILCCVGTIRHWGGGLIIECSTCNIRRGYHYSGDVIAWIPGGESLQASNRKRQTHIPVSRRHAVAGSFFKGCAIRDAGQGASRLGLGALGLRVQGLEFGVLGFRVRGS